MRESSLRNKVLPVNLCCLQVPVVFRNISLNLFHYARDCLCRIRFLFPLKLCRMLRGEFPGCVLLCTGKDLMVKGSGFKLMA